ncbi:MAG: M56 family metallopeptidase [Bacteroidia bacterium]
MIHYLFTSALLVLIGWGLYVSLVRNKASLRERKWFIYLSIFSSLALPLSVTPLPELAESVQTAPIAFGSIDEAHLQQYCRCERPNYSHRIQYRANAFYSFVFANKAWINRAFGLAVGFVLLFLLLQLHFLYRLVRSAKQEKRSLNGIDFYLLSPKRTLGVGAFQLRHRYIIWQQEMEALSQSEQEAIFRHELSHLRQHNTFEKAALRLVQCLWFFHPVFYYFRKELELLSECIADQAGSQAMPHPRRYAELLLKLKSQQFDSLVQYFGGGILKSRIQILLNEPRPLKGIAIVVFVGLASIQLWLINPLSAQIAETLYELETYEEIYHKVPPKTEAAVYCTDCNTVCQPE